MTGKPITGKSFGGCVRYVVNKPEATILDAEGLRIQDAESITADFNLQRRLRPGLGQAVGHSVLSWSEQDKDKLTDQLIVQVAKEYMDKMEIYNTQYLLVRHSDKAHPHVHIIYNRVDNHGQTIPDKNNYQRNVKACRDITDAYGFYLGKGKEQVNRQALKGKDKVRYAIYDAVKLALKTARNWDELKSNLRLQGIGVLFKFKGNSDEIQGISFEKDGVTFKGSSVDRSMSFARIEMQLKSNNAIAVQQRQSGSTGQKSKQSRPVPQTHSNPAKEAGKSFLDILFETTHNEYVYDPISQGVKKRKKKKKKPNQ